MNSLSKLNNIDDFSKENLYLYFKIAGNNYAIPANQVLEIMKLPLLEYPQKLPNNIIGLLNYGNFTISVLDVRFYLNIKVTPYDLSNHLLVVKTDESIFALIVEKVEDIIPFEHSKIEHLPYSSQEKLIEFLYHKESETISIINLFSLENIMKQSIHLENIDVQELFPKGDEVRYKLMQRTNAIAQRAELNLTKNIFAQNKFISFVLNQGIYCFSLEYVKEFLKNFTLTPIPGTPDFIKGVVTLRGDFISAIDLKKFLGLSHDTKSYKEKFIVIESEELKIGICVDEILEIMDIPEELLTANLHNRPSKYVLSEIVLEEKLYTILNMKNILTDERLFIKDSG